jgi:signal transduction histidine kinase
MDNPAEGYLLIGVTMFIMSVLLIAILMVMLIYRRRRLVHVREMKIMKDKYDKEIMETQLGIQQETMQQIGREIHDNVGQKLTLAALYTTHLNLGDNNERNPEKIHSIGELINESLSDLRALSQNLTQVNQAGMELDVLLRREVNKLNQAEVCKAQFHVSGIPLVPAPEITNMILRIVQEFLQNSIKHADCRNIYLQLQYEEECCHVNIKDVGAGFILTAPLVRNGIGIENMKKRAALAGAQLILKSSPGKGTELDLIVPVHKNA